MFSTIKFLKTGRLLSKYMTNEGAKGFHVQVVSQGKSLGSKWGVLLKNRQTLSSLGIANCIKYESTDAANISVLDPIPEPPIPLTPPPTVEQFSEWMQTIETQVLKSGNCITHETEVLNIENATELPSEKPNDTQILEELGILPKQQPQEFIIESSQTPEPIVQDEVFPETTNIQDARIETSEILNDIAPSSNETLEESLSTAYYDPIVEKQPVENIILEDLPDAPVPLQDLPGEVIEILGEPTFESIGLGGWTPVGVIQNCMEYLHIACDLPWWTSIVIGTLVVRILMFPLVIMSQRNAAKMNNNLPEMQAIQLKMSEARERGDRLDAARYAQEMMAFMSQKGMNPIKNMLVPLAQAPLFISFFMGLRGMANLPIESMRDGGLYWFMDLTLPDQFYLLPLITSATLALTVELGTDTARLNSSNMGAIKYILRAMPIVIFPFTMNFPAAILVYWTSSNFISLVQVATLRIPRVREYFKIEKIVKHKPDDLPIKKKGFVTGVKDSWTNMKITRELEDRERVDAMNFTRAGRGAIKKTYKYDPTLPRLPQNITIQAKKRTD